MMRMRSKPAPAPAPAPPGVTSNTNGGSAAGDSGAAAEWEVRPGGMLVQKRNPDSDRSSAPPPTIRVRVKYGSTYHDMCISSQATFGKHLLILFYFTYGNCLFSLLLLVSQSLFFNFNKEWELNFGF